MNIYKYTPDVNSYDVLRVKKTGKAVVDSILGDPLASSWSRLTASVEVETGEIGDFPRLDAHVPVVSERAWHVLEPVIGSLVEALPLNCSAGDFFALNVLVTEDCLDSEFSEFGKLKNGVVYSVRRHVFKTGLSKILPIFRLPQVRKDILVTDAFREVVERAKLTGLLWHPVGSVTFAE